MKKLLVLIGMMLVFCSVEAQTNIINISNSRVVINNIYMTSPTNTVPLTNVVSEVKSNKFVVLPREVVERLQWETMLQERQRVAFRSYLRKLDR